MFDSSMPPSAAGLGRAAHHPGGQRRGVVLEPSQAESVHVRGLCAETAEGGGGRRETAGHLPGRGELQSRPRAAPRWQPGDARLQLVSQNRRMFDNSV